MEERSANHNFVVLCFVSAVDHNVVELVNTMNFSSMKESTDGRRACRKNVETESLVACRQKLPPIRFVI